MSAPRLLGAAALVVMSVAVTASARSRFTQAPSNWRASFTAAALQIPFDSERPPVPFDGVPADAKVLNAPKMTIASARTRDTAQASRLEARITSAAAYPRLGIAPGVNYLWRDSVNGAVRHLIIPADTAYRARWLTVTAHQHAPPKQIPRLLVVRMDALAASKSSDTAKVKTALYAYGECTRGCGTGSWCLVRDTLLSSKAFELKPPLDAIGKYFARNKVVWKKS
jgi:hypothetical protein